MEDVRLVGIDIDGTLLDSRGEISAATHRELERLHRRGVLLVLVTGRRFHTASQVAAKLRVPVLLAVHNGAALRERDGTYLYADLLPEREARIACRVGQENGAFAWVYQDDEDGSTTRIYCEPRDRAPDGLEAYIGRYFDANPGFITVLDDLSREFVGATLEVMLTTPQENGDAVIAAATEALDGRARVIEERSRGICHIEVAHPRVSKARPLAFLAAKHGIPREAILAVGDNYNDLDMLEYAGHAVVMGNAHLPLHGYGYRVTATNDDDGLAQVLAEIG